MYTKPFQKDDEYMTPKSAWESVAHLIPKDKIVYEAFYGDGTSGKHLRELGFNVIHEPIDFFQNTNLGDIVVSNPPFTMKKEVLETLLNVDKPFILLMPLATLSREYFRRLFIDKEFMLALPQKRIQFIKQGHPTSKCNFECAFFCYGLGRSGVCFLEDKG
jgi:hypothetical protein